MGKTGDEATRTVAGPLLLRVSAQGVLQERSLIMTMILDRLRFRSLRHFGKRSMLARVGCIFDCL